MIFSPLKHRSRIMLFASMALSVGVALVTMAAAQLSTSANPTRAASQKALMSTAPSRRPGTVSRQVPMNQSGQSNGNDIADTLQTAIPLKIALTPSETPLKLGSDSNIAADIQNVSNLTVMVDPTSIQLMTHAILSNTDSLCVLPVAATTNTTLAYMGYVYLRPQDHYDVIFNLSQKPYSSQQIETLETDMAKSTSTATGQPVLQSGSPALQPSQYAHDLQAFYQQACAPGPLGVFKRAIDFTPGNYDYFVSGKFVLCASDLYQQNPCQYPWRSFGQSATFQVGMDQTLIIIFAVVGGWLAYFVVTVRGADGPIADFFTLVTSESGFQGVGKAITRDGLILIFKIIRDMFGVAVLSAAFTIVSSRLSDSQFPIKVSVLDGWGAMTVGFLSYFVGSKLIDSLRNLVK